MNANTFSTLQALAFLCLFNQGRRAPLRFTLVPGYHSPHLRRSVVTISNTPTVLHSENEHYLRQCESMQIDNVRAIVTGAASGLGRTFALELAKAGGWVAAGDIDT